MTDPELTLGTAIDQDIRDWLLAKPRYAVLAMVTPKGPNQSVMWFDLDPQRSDTILMNTKVGRAKTRWLRDGTPLSVLFEEGEFYYAFQGEAELDEDRARALEDIKSLARRYDSDPSKFDGQQRMTIRMRVTKVIEHL